MHRRVLLLTLSLIWLLAPSVTLAQSNPPGIPEDAVEATMVCVTDGDTIHVLIDGVDETVRLIGIDAPERGDTAYRQIGGRSREIALGTSR